MLTGVYAFNFIDRRLLVILQEPIKRDLILSDAQLGLLSGFSFAVLYVTAGIPIAAFADRGNRRNIEAGALAFWSAMTALSGLVQNYGQLLLARLGVGLGEAGGTPPAHAMIGDYFRPERRATALSVYSSGIYGGILLGYALGGTLADSVGWRAAFLLLGLPGILFATLVVLTVREPARGARAGSRRPGATGLRATLRYPSARRSFLYLALGCALTSFVGYGNGNSLPSLLIRHHGLSVGAAGLVLALLAGLAGGIGTFLGGFLSDRLARRDRRWYLWVPLAGGLGAFLPYYYVILGTHTATVLVVRSAVSVVNARYLGPCIATAQALVPARMRAQTSAVLFFVLNMIGLGLGPFLTPLASDVFLPLAAGENLRWAMAATATVGLLALLMFHLAARHLPADLAAAEPDAGPLP